MAGKVTLVGAGPGDAGLLTIKGYEIIKKADVVVYDRLVSKDILSIIPEDAEKIDAGKKSASHKIPQKEINKLLLKKALEGKNVVRLKGGDCFLFGRGGEELELLSENNIDFEVVPGITSALAVPAYAGIPVTHRDFVSSVHIITGHQKKDEPLKINFKNCVECNGTLVFLMGVANIDKIMNGLIENGMNVNMPCGVIEQGTTPYQKKVIATISTIGEKCRENNINSPAVIIVGEVCTLSEKFDWFNRLPLKGKSIVVTRPGDRAGSLTKKLRNLGANVIEYPCIETISMVNDSYIEEIIDKIKSFNWIVFTSPAGVKAVFECLSKRRLDGRFLADTKIAVIGSGTYSELEKYALYPDLMPEIYDGKNLGALLGKKAKGEKVLLLRAKDGSSEIIDELNKAEIEYEDMAVYYTIYTKKHSNELTEKIQNGDIDYVTFTSASTVKAFAATIDGGYDKFKGLCIGEKTNTEALKYGIKTIVSKNATIDDMVRTLVREM